MIGLLITGSSGWRPAMQSGRREERASFLVTERWDKAVDIGRGEEVLGDALPVDLGVVASDSTTRNTGSSRGLSPSVTE